MLLKRPGRTLDLGKCESDDSLELLVSLRKCQVGLGSVPIRFRIKLLKKGVVFIVCLFRGVWGSRYKVVTSY